MVRETFGQLLYRLRDEKRLSLRQVAEKVDVSWVQISNFENDRAKPTQEVVLQLAELFDYDPDKLLARAELVDPELEEIIRKRPTAVPDFLRSARNLTIEQWQELQKKAETMNLKKKRR